MPPDFLKSSWYYYYLSPRISDIPTALPIAHFRREYWLLWMTSAHQCIPCSCCSTGFATPKAVFKTHTTLDTMINIFLGNNFTKAKWIENVPFLQEIKDYSSFFCINWPCFPIFQVLNSRFLDKWGLIPDRGSLACTNFTSTNFTNTNFQMQTIPWIARTKIFTSTMFYKTAST